MADQDFLVQPAGWVIGVLTTVIVIGFVILGVTLIWFIYRIAKGWLRLNEGQPIS